jgi:hypothetical protein
VFDGLMPIGDTPFHRGRSSACRCCSARTTSLRSTPTEPSPVPDRGRPGATIAALADAGGACCTTTRRRLSASPLTQHYELTDLIAAHGGAEVPYFGAGPQRVVHVGR